LTQSQWTQNNLSNVLSLRYDVGMHHIQRKILEKLLYAEELNYAAMRPQSVESNLYAYHLEQLVKEGLVAKRDKQYALSLLGMSVIDRMSHKNMTARLQPHIVTVIDVTNGAGQTALFKRHFQPYINRYSFPLGKTHYEEDIMSAAVRELEEKTGLTGLPLTQRGILYLESHQGGVTVSKILCHVFQATVEGAPPIKSAASHRGEAVWLDHTALKPAQVMPGVFATKQLLQEHNSFFFAELSEEF
jgi:8-oxo-dGTP pyrophosphatase MutT (NUDIX family)